jgi:hypothetical protein
MPNINKKAYGLTTLCPIKNGSHQNTSYASIMRGRLQDLGTNEKSPMAKVPNTYLCRFYILNDVPYQGGEPAVKDWGLFKRWFQYIFYGKISVLEDHLKSKYLVFASNFYGDLDAYLEGAWNAASKELEHVFEHCVGFHKVKDETGFVEYIKKCQVETTFFFNGSVDPETEEDDEPLAAHLKGLYLKQEFSRFVYQQQGKSDADLQKAFQEFVARTQPDNTSGPTWRAGSTTP